MYSAYILLLWAVYSELTEWSGLLLLILNLGLILSFRNKKLIRLWCVKVLKYNCAIISIEFVLFFLTCLTGKISFSSMLSNSVCTLKLNQILSKIQTKAPTFVSSELFFPYWAKLSIFLTVSLVRFSFPVDFTTRCYWHWDYINLNISVGPIKCNSDLVC